jgi:hypothetical protein
MLPAFTLETYVHLIDGDLGPALDLQAVATDPEITEAARRVRLNADPASDRQRESASRPRVGRRASPLVTTWAHHDQPHELQLDREVL